MPVELPRRKPLLTNGLVRLHGGTDRGLRRGSGTQSVGGRGQCFAPVRLHACGLLGKIMCYAICALAMDLIWGYTGILSLGHGLFFALGGYVMGMYLMPRGRRPRSSCPPSWGSWTGRSCPGSGRCRAASPPPCILILRGARCLIGGRVRLVCLSLAHQGRVFLHHHPSPDLRRHAAVLPQRNRFRRQQRLHGLQATPWVMPLATREPCACAAVRADGAGILLGCFLLARWLMRSKFGRVLQAIRDAESRVPCSRGYDAAALQAVRSGSSRRDDVRPGGCALYVPQVGIINPSGR